MYSTNYNWKLFDSSTAKLTVEVNILWMGSVVETKIISMTLPTDSAGQVTTNTSVVDSIVDNRILRYFPDVVNNTRLPPYGVVNAQDMYVLTSDIEVGELNLVQGVIYDILGNPVAGAQVQSIASGTVDAVITDISGTYSLPAFAGLETITVTSPVGTSGPLLLWPRTQTTTVLGTTVLDITVRYAADYGSVITITDADTQNQTVNNTSRMAYNATVEIPAGAIVDSNGDPVADVTVSIANNVVSDVGMVNVFPGLFIGTVGSGSPGPIESYGFLEVRLADPAGLEDLSLDPTKPATISIPVNPDPVGVNSIPLWRLDETTGIWEQTGTATRVGLTNVFEATVTSFSFYNLDQPLPDTVLLTVSVYNDSYSPYLQTKTLSVPGVTITVDILQPDNGAVWQGRGITDQYGQLALVVPPGFLRVVGKKGTDTYNGFVYEQSFSSASIDLFKFAPPLVPPEPQPRPSVDLVVAAGNNYSTQTAFLVVQNASALLQVFEANRWAIQELGFDVAVVSINGNTLELSFPVSLTDFNLIPGTPIRLELYF